MGLYSNKYIPTIFNDITLGSAGITFRTVDYEGTLKFENNTWVFNPELSGLTPVTGDTLPDQSGNSGKYLTTDGSDASWGSITFPTEIPTQTGNSGKYLTTNGSALSWATVSAGDSLPSQTGNSGQILTTNGSAASWMTVPTEIPTVSGQTGKYLTNDGSTLSWATIDTSGSTSTIETVYGTESLLLGSNSITFPTNLSTADYVLFIRCYNSIGDNVNYRLNASSKLVSGFTISVSADCTLEYRASVGNGEGSGGSGSGTELVPTDNILDWNTTTKCYKPYTSKPTGLGFYTGTTNPTDITRINLNGCLYPTAVQAESSTGAGAIAGISSNGRGVYGYSSNFVGVYGASGNGVAGWFQNTAANLSNILQASVSTAVSPYYAIKFKVDMVGNVEVTTIGSGVILKSPDSTRYKITVNNGGTLSVTAL